MSYRDLPRTQAALHSLISAVLGGILGAALVLAVMNPACADAAMRGLLAIGLRG